MYICKNYNTKKMKQKVIEVFDKQIYFELKTNKNKPENCISYWSKKLFIAELSLTLDDWREIRKDDYYEEISLKSGIEKQKYRLYKIKEYLNK